ncbi:hypothetical protein FB561_0804 [Kribbella amoyensis]|uniref:DUF2637 domain-containing protein n=1 Tax=Kribbella amoyensis TaxID=996641 RepID=A0A561BLJ9_9ACTN|nr:hypothetical protein [Kribbella amoyensis]TWD79739.1 hypothetical protein FB561_0804 [Kribbella amoyensis]
MTITDELPESPNRSGDHVLQENTTSTSTGELNNVPLTGADKVAYAFYATAATAALVGQVWAGVTHIPWPEEGFSTFLKIALVTPAVAVIELGGVATAALADLRRRKGEQAYAYRAMSLFAAIVALVFNVVGHWRPEERFLAFGFGGLSAFAYVLWLIHSSARRRDALRRSGQMANTGPVYGVVQWLREPRITWLARSLAIEHGLGMFESIRAAREQMRNAARRNAIAGTVAEYIRSEHQDERLAKIAETTYDPDRLAGMLEERINYDVITNKLTRAISPPPEPADEQDRDDLRAAVWVVEGTTRKPQQLRPADGGVSIRDEDAWEEAMTGELMAIVEPKPDRSAEAVAEAEVVEDEAEKASPVVQKPQPPSPFAPAETGITPGLLPADQPASRPSPRPAAATTTPPVSTPAASPGASSTVQRTPVVEPVITPTPISSVSPSRPVVEEAVVATPAITESVRVDEPAEPAARSTASSTRTKPAAGTPRSAGGNLDKKRMRAWALLSDWPEDRTRDAATLAAAIASSEKDAATFIAQYDVEHGLVSAQ